MLKRALVGLLKGVLIGAVLGLTCVYGLGMPVFAAWAAYLVAVVTGALTGLVAGKPIWAKGARIEAGLKSGVGALLAAGAMFAIRQWLNVPVNLGALGHGLVGELPIASIPLVAATLALLFELDNTKEPEQPEKKRVETGPAELGSADSALDAALLEEEAEASDAKKARRN
jgi:hypothetical protein